MGYERRPFQPATPYPNQVATELNKANDNFDLLAQAFVSDNPETLKVKNALNSDNAINSTNAVNSDTLDGFHASQTPTPNTIPVALSTGKLDLNWLQASQTPTPNTIPVALSTGKLDLGWLPDNLGGGYRRIDLTDATTDYDLQLGEEAYIVWDTTASLTRPLRIQVSGSLYQLFISVPQNITLSSDLKLLPNNTTASFDILTFYIDNTTSPPSNNIVASSTVFIYRLGMGGVATCLLQTTTQNKTGIFFANTSNQQYRNLFGSFLWSNTTTVWSSLGTLQVGRANGTIYVLVRRIL